ncbi:MAG: cell division protein FtsW [Anaerolineae bacterium]|nr:cell division protein FtsW [Anaerolineae bacterium]
MARKKDSQREHGTQERQLFAQGYGPDWILLAVTAGLLALGLMMVYSATSDLGYREYGSAAHFFKRQMLWLAIGTVGLVIAARIPYHLLMKFSIPMMAVTLSTLSILAFFREGRLLFDQSVSPVEMAKLATIVYIAHWLSSKADVLGKVPYGLLPFTIMVGVVTGLVVAQPDLSEALVIILVSVAMFFLAGADLLQFTIGILGGGAAFAFVITRLPHAMERLEPYLSELRDPLHSSNVQLSQGLVAMGSGGILGLGPGSGRMKYQWLPAAHTDSIFAIVGEELGLIGCLLLIGLFALLAYRGLRIALLAPDAFGRLLAAGVTCWITFQALINMAVVTGTIPFTGIALPFISVGGSSLIMCMAGVGILLSVSRTIPEQSHLARQAYKTARVSGPDTRPGDIRARTVPGHDLAEQEPA